MNNIQLNKFITSSFVENTYPKFYEAIGKEYNLKYRPDKNAQDEGVVNTGIDDNSIVFETVKTFIEQIDDNTDELETNQTNKTQYSRLIDSRADDIYATESNQLMVAENQRISGGVFNSTNAGGVADINFFTTTNVANGTSTITNSELTLAVTTDSGSSTLIYTNSRARCIGGTMNQYRERSRLGDLGQINNIRRWGLIETNAFLNAVYFQLSGTTFSIVAKTNGLSDIVINNGSFNGEIPTVILDTNYHLYTVNYVNGLFKLFIDDVLIHTLKETNTIICGTRNLRAFAQNINIGIGSACNLYVRFMTITMFGSRKTQPKYFNQQGLTSGALLKAGVGSLHSINISGITNNSVITLYDGLNTSGAVIYTTGAMTNQTVPISIPFNDGIIFDVGLYLTVTAAASNAQVIYE